MPLKLVTNRAIDCVSVWVFAKVQWSQLCRCFVKANVKANMLDSDVMWVNQWTCMGRGMLHCSQCPASANDCGSRDGAVHPRASRTLGCFTGRFSDINFILGRRTSLLILVFPLNHLNFCIQAVFFVLVPQSEKHLGLERPFRAKDSTVLNGTRCLQMP